MASDNANAVRSILIGTDDRPPIEITTKSIRPIGAQIDVNQKVLHLMIDNSGKTAVKCKVQLSFEDVDAGESQEGKVPGFIVRVVQIGKTTWDFKLTKDLLPALRKTQASAAQLYVDIQDAGVKDGPLVTTCLNVEIPEEAEIAGGTYGDDDTGQPR